MLSWNVGSFFLRANIKKCHIFVFIYIYILCECDIERLHLHFQDEHCCRQHFALNGTPKASSNASVALVEAAIPRNIDLKTVGINDPSIFLLQQPQVWIFRSANLASNNYPRSSRQKESTATCLNLNQLQFTMLNGRKSSRICLQHPQSCG